MQTRTFDDIRAQAGAEWEALARSQKPRIFVGTATCGLAAGAEAVLKTIEIELTQRGIEAVITQVGCFGLCYSEPMVDIARPGEARVSYGGVTPEIVPRLIEEHVVNGRPCADLALGTVGEGSAENVPPLSESAVLETTGAYCAPPLRNDRPGEHQALHRHRRVWRPGQGAEDVPR